LNCPMLLRPNEAAIDANIPHDSHSGQSSFNSRK
jgi:hypothetical protein